MLNKFQKLADKLQNASMEIPVGRSLFTPIDMAISGNPYCSFIAPTLRQWLKDWLCLIQCMAKKPTSVLQLIVAAPTYISYTDVCRLGAGGVWCIGKNFWILYVASGTATRYPGQSGDSRKTTRKNHNQWFGVSCLTARFFGPWGKRSITYI